MDPLSAVSLASAVIQFVDFGSRLLRDTVEIYQSQTGGSHESDHISKIAGTISDLSEDVEHLSGAVLGSPAQEKSSEAVFLRLCGECKRTGEELQDCIDKVRITVTGDTERVLPSFRAALQKQWSKKKIEKLLSRLGQLQQGMMTALLVFLWGDRKSNRPERLQIARQSASILDSLERSQHTQQTGSIGSPAGHGALNREHTQKVMWDLLQSHVPHRIATLKGAASISGMPLRGRGLDFQSCSCLLEELNFDDLHYRKKTIEPAHAKTFEWIFHEPLLDEEGEPAWSSFTDWLSKEPENIYWITGKPGSGKSTLIKFLLDDPRTVEHLQKWAPQAPLLVLDYYSYNSGHELQKSPEGLLRTMLYEALQQRMLLIPKVFFARWAMHELYGTQCLLPKIGLEDLIEAFKIFVAEVTKEGKAMVVIDGLDEFKSDHHGQLVNLIQDISRLPRLKVCVSSRPQEIFQDSYGRNPSLMVERLTKGDIQLYVQDHFGRCNGFQELRAIHPAQADELVQEIVRKAQGVFLWVRVVVAALVEGSSKAARISKLRETLDTLPDEVTKLFQAIWNRIRPEVREEAIQLLHIMEASTKADSPLPGLVLWLSDREYSIEASTEELETIDQAAVTLALKRRLASWTKGLLEIQIIDSEEDNKPRYGWEKGGSRVTYMHRTVREWILGNIDRSQFVMDSVYDPNLILLKGWALREGAGLDLQGIPWFWSKVQYMFRIATFVKDVNTNLPLFYSVLDRINIELQRQIRATMLNRKRLGYEGVPLSAAFVNSEEFANWTTLQIGVKTDFEDRQILKFLDAKRTSTTYIGFVSQLPLANYVRSKVEAEPELLNYSDPDILNPAEVLPFDVGFTHQDDPILAYPSRWTDEYKEKKMELLQFLIEKGANVRRLKAHLMGERQWSWQPKDEEWKARVLQTILDTEFAMKQKRRGSISRFIHGLTPRKKLEG